MNKQLASFFIAISLLVLPSCSPHKIRTFEEAPIDLPEHYENQIEFGSHETKNINWWKQFGDEKLDQLVEKALNENYTLKESWARLRQSKALAMAAGSSRYPQADVSGGVSRTRAENLEATSQQIIGTEGVFYETSYFVRNGLSFEIDLWQRAANASRAEAFRAEASLADYKNTQLLLVSGVVENWFVLKENAALVKLLEEQIGTSETLLELTQLRFSVGRGNALDVLQQRQQLSAIRSELPRAKANYERTKNALSVLLGSPVFELAADFNSDFSGLPEFPNFVKPKDILTARPDLAAAKLRLHGAEYDLASAFAERFPRFSLGLGYDFSASRIDDLFERELSSISGNFLLPFIDGGRRRAFVRQKDARVEELIASYAQLVLTAFRDVEDALITEKYQKELVERIEQQLKDARATLAESRSRYLNGLTDYLQVTLAIQSVQGLERRLVSEKRALFVARSKLYLAIGGVVQPQAEQTEIKEKKV